MSEKSYGEEMMEKAIRDKDWLDGERKAKAEEEQKAKEEAEARDRENRQKWDAQDYLADVLEQGKPSEERQKFISEKTKSLKEKMGVSSESKEETPARNNRARTVVKREKEYR